jgi:hypothetical protein
MRMVFQFCFPHYHLAHSPEEMSFVRNQVVKVDFLGVEAVAAVVVDQEVEDPDVVHHDEGVIAVQVGVDRGQQRRAG